MGDNDGVIRLLVVDDHVLVRQGIVALIERRDDVRVVAEAGSGEEALAAYREHRPDVALVDLRLGGTGMDGIELMRRVRVEFPQARFVVLTTHEGGEDVFRAIRAGAQGYVLKGAAGADLMEAIRAVHGGERWVPASLATRAVERAASGEFTERETAVLVLIAKGKANKEIASELGIEESTVKTHVTGIFTKLGVTSRTQAIVAAVQLGLVRL